MFTGYYKSAELNETETLDVMHVIIICHHLSMLLESLTPQNKAPYWSESVITAVQLAAC